MNAAIIDWLQGLGHHVTVLLVSARLAFPIERYDLTPVAGPHVKSLGSFVFARNPSAVARICAKVGVKLLPPRLATRLRSARHNADAVLGGFASEHDLRWCARHIARTAPVAVLIDTIFRARLLDEPQMAKTNSVVIAHDVFHRRHAALTRTGYSVLPRNLSRENEAALLGKARHIAAIQPEERYILGSMCPASNVFTASMPATPYPPATVPLPGRLVFVGSATLPNLDGLRWCLGEVWPLLAGHGITLDLVGDCGAALGKLPPGISRLGRIQNLAPVLHRAALAIAPLRSGSGLKIKLLDYARHGLFTVATPQSLEGFASDPAAPFIAAETPEAFASAILRQLESPSPPTQALGYITRHYSAERCFGDLGEAIHA